ncbi:hypothetical protein M0804_014382 [Polistes exclamans]|nr:hypothetical protein M0804_014382 [Polistes exclamans]
MPGPLYGPGALSPAIFAAALVTSLTVKAVTSFAPKETLSWTERPPPLTGNRERTILLSNAGSYASVTGMSRTLSLLIINLHGLPHGSSSIVAKKSLQAVALALLMAQTSVPLASRLASRHVQILARSLFRLARRYRFFAAVAVARKSDKRTLAASVPHVRSITLDPGGRTHVGRPTWLNKLRFILLAQAQSHCPLRLRLPSGSHLVDWALKSPATSTGRAGNIPKSSSSSSKSLQNILAFLLGGK